MSWKNKVGKKKYYNQHNTLYYRCKLLDYIRFLKKFKDTIGKTVYRCGICYIGLIRHGLKWCTDDIQISLYVCDYCGTDTEALEKALAIEPKAVEEKEKWFGKRCEHQCCQWEDNEMTGGPEYKEDYPTLIFCSHTSNTDEYEGNCQPHLCPLNLKEKEG